MKRSNSIWAVFGVVFMAALMLFGAVSYNAFPPSQFATDDSSYVRWSATVFGNALTLSNNLTGNGTDNQLHGQTIVGPDSVITLKMLTFNWWTNNGSILEPTTNNPVLIPQNTTLGGTVQFSAITGGAGKFAALDASGNVTAATPSSSLPYPITNSMVSAGTGSITVTTNVVGGTNVYTINNTSTVAPVTNSMVAAGYGIGVSTNLVAGTNVYTIATVIPMTNSMVTVSGGLTITTNVISGTNVYAISSATLAATNAVVTNFASGNLAVSGYVLYYLGTNLVWSNSPSFSLPTLGPQFTVGAGATNLSDPLLTGSQNVSNNMTISNVLTVTESGTANTQQITELLTNTAQATSGNQQYSPFLRYAGNGWKTTATAGSQPISFSTGIIPVQGSAGPLGYYAIYASTNGSTPVLVWSTDWQGNTTNSINYVTQTIISQKMSVGGTFGATTSYGLLAAGTPFGWESTGLNLNNAPDAYFNRVSVGTIAVDTNLIALGTITATNGLASYRSNLAAPFAITFPATTVNWTNPLTVNIEVYIDNSGITGTAIKKNGTQIFSSLVGDCTFHLQSGEYFSETYTIGTPSGTWSPY